MVFKKNYKIVIFKKFNVFYILILGALYYSLITNNNQSINYTYRWFYKSLLHRLTDIRMKSISIDQS